MSWSISTQHMKSIRSFEAAREHFEQTKQPRGAAWGPRDRPLSTNREYHKRLVTDPTGSMFACVLYSTELVAYHADGGVQVTSYGSRSTFEFIYSMLPPGINAYNFRGQMFFEVMTREGPIYLPPGSYRLDPVMRGVWKCTGPLPTRQRLVYDRSHAARIRSKFRPFVTFANASRALLGETPRNRLLPAAPKAFEALLKLPQEEWALHAHHVTPSFYVDAEHALGARRGVEIPLTEMPKVVRNASYIYS